MAEKKGKSFGELFEDNGSMANTGELPQEPAGDEEMDEDELGNELDSDLANIADDLATALVGAMDSVLGGEAGDDLADVPDMLDKADDKPGVEGDPEQDPPSDDAGSDDGGDEMPPPEAGNDEPDGVDLPDRDHDDEDESMEGGEEGGADVHDKLDSLEAKLDMLLKDEEGEQNEGETFPPGSEEGKPELEEEGDENKMVEAGDENKMLENFFGSIKRG